MRSASKSVQYPWACYLVTCFPSRAALEQAISRDAQAFGRSKESATFTSWSAGNLYDFLTSPELVAREEIGE
jgi:hypothetical protein